MKVEGLGFLGGKQHQPNTERSREMALNKQGKAKLWETRTGRMEVYI